MTKTLFAKRSTKPLDMYLYIYTSVGLRDLLANAPSAATATSCCTLSRRALVAKTNTRTFDSV